MDQGKTGAFIAALRRERGWTQEELGERLGITNKTVSRWENGNYLPSVEMMSLLSRELGVTLNELVEGRRLDEADFRTAADRNLTSALERPRDRFRRWASRYGTFTLVTAALCCVLGAILWGHVQYVRAHPEDVRPVGTFCTDPSTGNGEYAVLDQDGHFYRYRQFQPLDQGTCTADGSLVTVQTGERRFQMLISGRTLYLPETDGRLTAFEKISDIPVFINAFLDLDRDAPRQSG